MASTTPRVSHILRHPLANQLGRYAITGVIVAFVYIGLTLLLSGPLGLPIQAAIPLSYLPAACVHFTLQRFFVFAAHRGTFRLEASQQAGRYVVLNLGQYAVTAIGTWALGRVTGIDDQVAYLICTLSVTVFTFLMLRTRVFHAE